MLQPMQSTPRRTKRILDFLDSNNSNCRFIHFIDGEPPNILSPEQFDEWGWRVPFWVSIIMVGVSYLIRKNMDESPFLRKQNQKETQVQTLKRKFRKSLQFKICSTGII
jgi:hypothetical protein